MNNTARTMSVIAAVAILAVAAIGVGFAYTASTQNEDNQALAAYVKLSQTNYLFEDVATYYYDTVDKKATTGTGGETSYYLLTEEAGGSDKHVKTPVKLGTGVDAVDTYKKVGENVTGFSLVGSQIGADDTLKAEVGAGTATAPFYVTLSYTADSIEFGDGDDMEWAFVVLVYNTTAEDYQYALIQNVKGGTEESPTYEIQTFYYKYDATNGWAENTDAAAPGFVLAKDTAVTEKIQSYEYTTAVYLAANFGAVETTEDMEAVQTVAPPSMDHCTITFLWDSTKQTPAP